jgi:hypothetical protein
MDSIPPTEEWLSAKEVAAIFGVSVSRVYFAHSTGRRNSSGSLVRLTMFRTLSGLATTRKLVDEFLLKLNG